MYIPYHILLPLLVMLSGCRLFNSDDPPVPFEPVFTAEINGEPYDGTKPPYGGAQAVMTMQGDYDFLTIFAYQYSEEWYPYNEYVGIHLIYEEGTTTYPTRKDTVQINEVYDLHPGGGYGENDGDAIISTYHTQGDDDGFITVGMEELGDGRTVVFGTFEMRVIVSGRANQYSRRVGQDTLHITNGEYRVLLDDRRD